MNPSPVTRLGLTLAGGFALLVLPARADNFGSGVNTFTIDFVNIGNAGNADDAGAGGGLYSSPYGGVAYEYRMGTFEISVEQLDKVIAGGLTGMTPSPHTGAEPMSLNWYRAAAFVNWLNTTTGHQAAYQLTGVTALTLWSAANAWDNDPGAGVELNLYRHKDAYYFLPSEDEWYKGAFLRNASSDRYTLNHRQL